jgi:hypothetical protein
VENYQIVSVVIQRWLSYCAAFCRLGNIRTANVSERAKLTATPPIRLQFCRYVALFMNSHI